MPLNLVSLTLAHPQKPLMPLNMDWAIDELVPGMIYPIMTIAYIDQSVIAAPTIGVDDGKRVNPTRHNPL